VPYGVDLHSVLVLVNAVDDPVGPAPRGVVTIEGFIKWLPDAVRAGSERPVDRLHGSGSDIKGWILVQVTPCLSGEDDGVRSFSLWSGRVRITGHDVRRRRCSSSARTCPASKVSPAAKSSRLSRPRSAMLPPPARRQHDGVATAAVLAIELPARRSVPRHAGP
jgi:hypothetical protein